MKSQSKSLLVAVSMFMLAMSVSVKAQIAPDLEVSAPRFVYDVNANFESRTPSNGKRPIPATTVTNSPVQQVSALFRNTGTKSIKSIGWECLIFKDAQETEVLHIYTMRSKTTLLPGQTVRLEKLGYHLKNSKHIRARVTQIEYDDGTIWQGAKTKR
jgi:hypothetical protein